MMINDLTVSAPSQKNNIVVFFLRGPAVAQHYINLSDGLEKKLVTIKEKDEKLNINFLKINNQAAANLLLLNGEHISGYRLKQNRIVARSIIVKGKSEALIRVRCAEKKRWSHLINNELKTSDSLFFAREHLMRSQARVWSSIEQQYEQYNIKSFTLSAEAIYLKRKKLIDNFVDFFKPPQGTIGLALGDRYQINSLDLFSDSNCFQTYYKKILRGYAIENLKNINYTSSLVPDDVHKFMYYIKKSNKLALKNEEGTLGKKFLLQSDQIVGSILYRDKTVIHCAAFVNSNLKEFPESDKDYKVA